MKRLLTIISAFALTASVTAASAQEQKSEFRPHWSMQVQGGVGHTVGETAFTDLLSPAAAIYGRYDFCPVFGLRAGLSGWQARGFLSGSTGASTPHLDYKWNYLQGDVDALFDLCNIFAGFRAGRIFNPYLLAGVGGNYSFGQDDKVKNNTDRFRDPDFVWTDSKFFPACRLGAGVDIRLSNVVYLSIEANTNILPNKFNCKSSDNVDWQNNLLAGLTFKFGGNSGKAAAPGTVTVDRPAKTAAKAAPSKTGKPAPAKAEEAAPAKTENAAPAKAEKAAPAAGAPDTSKAAAAPEDSKAPSFEPISDNIFFTIGRYVISASEQAKIDALAAKMKAAAPASIVISGYADKGTGSAARNMFLSQKRAEVVKAAFVKAGIAEKDIEIKFYGSEVNPFQIPAQNRVAVCIVYAE